MKKTAVHILGSLRHDSPTYQGEVSHRIFHKYHRGESSSSISIETRKLVKKGLLKEVPGRDSLGRDTAVYGITEFGKIAFDMYEQFLSHWYDSSLLGTYWQWLSVKNRPALRRMFERHSSCLNEIHEYIQGASTPPVKKETQLLYSPGRFEVGLRVSSFSQLVPQKQIEFIDFTESSLDLADRFQSGKATFGFMTLGAIEGVLEHNESVERELIPIWIGSRESEATLIIRHEQKSRKHDLDVIHHGSFTGDIYCTTSEDRAAWASEIASQVGSSSYEIEGSTEDLLRGFMENDFKNIVSISPGTDLLLMNFSDAKVVRRGCEPLIGLVSRQVYQDYPSSVIGILSLINSTSFRGPDWKLYRLTDYVKHFPDLFPSLSMFNPRLKEVILRARDGKSEDN
jgi:DNA-binding PadR family transcriptional regulator